MRKREYDVPLFLLLAVLGGFCACNQSKETGITATPAGLLATPLSTPEAAVTGLPENRNTLSLTPEVTVTMPLEMTGTPSITEALGNSPTPSVTETPAQKPEKERIPIDEAHFTSEAFREYIYETYDKDRDGMLSAKEREAVKEIDLQSFGEMRFLNETLDGFEQFPCLEAVSIGLTGKVIIQGHPAIKFFGGAENAVQEVIIADCPALERIGFYLSDLGNISVKNCPELKEFSVENGDVDNADTVWEFLGTPQLIFVSDVAPGRLILDADAALKAYYGTYQPEFFTFDEERQLCYCGTRVEWVNRSEINMPASVLPEIAQRLEERALQIYKVVSVLDSRFSSTVEGRESNRLVVLKRLSEDAPVYVRFYSEKEQPELGDFSFSCDGKAVIDVYSPNRAVTQHWEGWISLVYEEDGEKQELFQWKERTAPITLFVGLTEDGTAIAEEAELDYIINTVEKWSGIRQVAAQGGTVVGLKKDGSVVMTKEADIPK